MIITQLSLFEPSCPAGEMLMIETENASSGSLPSLSLRIGTFEQSVFVPSSLGINANVKVELR